MPQATAAQPPSTTELLHAAQQHVRDLFAAYGTDEDERERLRAPIAAAIEALLHVEDGLIYPRLTARLDALALQAAHEDHQCIRLKLQRAHAAKSGVALDTAMTELAQITLAHLSFEEGRLPEALKRIDTPALREQVSVVLAGTPSPRAQAPLRPSPD